MEKKLELYGASWCMKSAKLRNYMQSKWIEFDDFDVEQDVEAEARVRRIYDGQLKFPTLVYGDEHLKNPTIEALNEFLRQHNLFD